MKHLVFNQANGDDMRLKCSREEQIRKFDLNENSTQRSNDSMCAQPGLLARVNIICAILMLIMLNFVTFNQKVNTHKFIIVNTLYLDCWESML